MKSYRHKPGFTLVEMLIVVGIISILVTMVIGVAVRIDNKAKEQLAESSIAILTATLEQFADFGYNYKDATYFEFDFPLDCNGFSVSDLGATLGWALGTTISIIADDDDPNYSGSETLYFFLSRVPECRKTLDKIDRSLIISNGTITDTTNNREYPLLRIVDPWRKTLRYDYYADETDPDSKRNFPVITSAGPDGIFGTNDDVSSR